MKAIKKILAAGAIVASITLGISTIASGEIVRNFDHAKERVPDVNKTWVNDSKMCWAATVSNLIAFSQRDVDLGYSIYEWFKVRYENKGRSMYSALKDYFMDLCLNDERCTEDKHIFYLGTYVDLWDGNSSLRNWIKGSLLQYKGVGVGLKLPNKDIYHSITIYAYEYKQGKRWLMAVDSDDQVTKAFVFSIEDQGKHVMITSGRLKGYTIVGGVALSRIKESK